MTMDNRKRYNAMEIYLQRASGAYVSVKKHEKMENNIILKKVLETLIQRMKEKDARFRQLYQRIFFGGSYYDGLKVGKPDEYDIDLLFKFPSTHTLEIRTGKVPGYVHLYKADKTGFEIFFQNDGQWDFYLDTKKVLSWMEGVLQKALDAFDDAGPQHISINRKKSHVVFHKTDGPAFTLVVTGQNGDEVIMNVDLVPSFLFNGDRWPLGFKTYTYRNRSGHVLSEFFVVPKHPRNVTDYETKYWRLAFQMQERHIIHDKGRLKPALRMLKKMRDVQQHKKMYSYFLKTIVLWEVTENAEPFWRKSSLSYTFMHILKKWQQCLENKEILYFWTIAEYNLLETVKVDLSNMSNRLRFIINKIESNLPDNPHIVLQYILTPEELANLYPKAVLQGMYVEEEEE